jgi:hypothetical protein
MMLLWRSTKFIPAIHFNASVFHSAKNPTLLASRSFGAEGLPPTPWSRQPRQKRFFSIFAVFQGNSGGPVYMVDQNRAYQGNLRIGETIQLIVGLVTQETTHNEQLIGPYNAEVHRYPLGLATVVHANFIKEAINMLPTPDVPPVR